MPSHVQLPGRVDDVTLLVLLRVKQHDDTPETQTVGFVQIKTNKNHSKVQRPKMSMLGR